MEKTKEQNAFWKKLNPVSNLYGKAFQIPLNKSVVDELNKFLRFQRIDKNISNNDFRNIINLTKKQDLKNNLTIFAQEVLPSNLKDKTKILTLIKLLSLFSAYKPRTNSQIELILKTHSPLRKLIEIYVEKNLPDWKEDIDLVTKNTNEFYSNKQQLVDVNLDAQHNYFWNASIKIGQIIESKINKIVQIPFNIVEELIKFQILFEESLLYLDKKSKTSLQSYVQYEHISKLTAQHYEELKSKLQDTPNIVQKDFLVHINETSKYIRLSDMPPITVSQVITLIFSYIILIGWAVVILLPLIQMITMSFDGSRYNVLAESPSASVSPWYIHYQNLFTTTKFLDWLSNSLIVAVATMVFTVLFTILLAYAFSRFRFPGRRSSIMSIMILQMVPSVAALTAFLILFYIFNVDLKIFLIIIYTGGGLTGNTFILKGYMDSIPVDLDEAAKIDGASTIKVFVSIIVPLAKPMIAIIGLWSFIGPFGDIILPQLLVKGDLQSIGQYTMAAGLRTLVIGTNKFQYEFLAGSIITAIPLTILFILTQKFLVSGLTKGAVK